MFAKSSRTKLLFFCCEQGFLKFMNVQVLKAGSRSELAKCWWPEQIFHVMSRNVRQKGYHTGVLAERRRRISGMTCGNRDEDDG